VRKADKDKSLYEDIAVVRLCGESPHVFRCDVMDYLTNRETGELLLPLTCISEYPRCVGYPVTLWLAHEFSAPSDSMLLSYHDQVEETLKGAGLRYLLRSRTVLNTWKREGKKTMGFPSRSSSLLWKNVLRD